MLQMESKKKWIVVGLESVKKHIHSVTTMW